MKVLQKDNVQLAKLNDTPIDEFDLNELNQLVQGLTKIRSSRQSKIKELKSELSKTEVELKTQEKQIEKNQCSNQTKTGKQKRK